MSTPNLCPEALNWLLANFQPGLMLNFIVTSKDRVFDDLFLGGFKRNEESLRNPLVIQRLRKKLQNTKLPGIIAKFMWICLNGNYAAIGMFSFSWLKKNWRLWLAGAQDPRIWAILWAAHDNEEISRLGFRLLRFCPSLWLKGSDAISEKFRKDKIDFSSFLSPSESRKPQTVTEAANAELRDLQNRFRELQSNKNAAEREAREAQQNNLRKQQDLENGLKKLREELQNLQQASALEKSALAARLEQEKYRELEQQRLELVGLTSEEFSSVQQEIAETGELEAEIDDMLRQQCQVDRKYGLHSQLHAELAKCQQLQQRLRIAMQESIHPLPQLPLLLQRLQEKCTVLENRLVSFNDSANDSGLNSDVSDRLFSRLRMIELNETTFTREITEFRNHLDYLKNSGLLFPHEYTSLAELVKKREREFQNSENLRNRNAWQMRQITHPWNFMDRFGKVRLFIDGHNLLLTTAGDISAQLFTEKSHELRKMCQKASQCFAGLTLVFDGCENSENREVLDRFVILYAARIEEAHNADRELVKALRSTEGERWLVTNDNDLKNNAKDCCEGFMDAWTFFSLLTELNKPIAQRNIQPPSRNNR